MKCINYTLSQNTVSLIEKAQKSAHDVRATVVKNKHDKVLAAQEVANKAFANANKSRQTDLFAALCKTEKPMCAVCTSPVYSVDAYSLDKENNVEFDTRESVIDFPAFIAYYNANTPEDARIPMEWHGLVKSAVKYAVINVAEEMEINQDKYIKRLNLTPGEIATAINPMNGVAHVSRATIKSALQSAVNALYGFSDNGKPAYWVSSADVKAFCQMIGFNKVNNSVVVPSMESATPGAMFYAVLRHVVGGEEYKVEMKEGRKASK